MYKIIAFVLILIFLNINCLFTNAYAAPIKGIYVNASSVKDEVKFNKLIQLVDQTGINAMVIDIKDDNGKVTYDSKLPLVNQIQSDQNPPIKNLAAIIQKLKEKNIYTIARIVVFKDPYLAKSKPEWAIKTKKQTIWKDASGIMWIDPHRKEVWDYCTSIAQEVAQLGFDEIQWDYVRFPDYKNIDREVVFANSPYRSKEEAIEGFLTFAYPKVKQKNVTISADVFGLTTSAKDDMGIGQKWERITQHVDVISPMMYPSHYANGSYGINQPESKPYQLIKEGLKDAKEKNSKISSQGKHTAIIRPWYQDFDMKVPYTLKHVQDQIRAGNEQGIPDYLLWSAKSNYSLGK